MCHRHELILSPEIIRIMDLHFDGYVHDLEIPFSQKKSGFRSYNQTGEWIQRQQISATYATLSSVFRFLIDEQREHEERKIAYHVTF